ncbi:MAG: histidinol-phosphate transaminase [Deferribacteres bacterium]|nr:histidinol-phosphate transaminase [Deferribacteres bacterium]
MIKFDLNALIRENIKQLKPYSSARHEFTGNAEVFLDANENALGSTAHGACHRYPDPLQTKLKGEIAAFKNIAADNLFIGNGSDESIDLLIRAFCEPARDNVLIVPPTYGMYAVSAAINNVSVLSVPLTDDFDLDASAVLNCVNEKTKLLFLCSPNNPTGNCLSAAEISKLLLGFSGLVVLDEAYIDFAAEKSFVPVLSKHQNLVILQTFSKAWGLAGVRIGLAIASTQIIEVLNKIKPPYNISENSQQMALAALKNVAQKDRMVTELLQQRNWLRQQLVQLDLVKYVYPSDANFLLAKFNDSADVYQYLAANGIIVRDRSSVAKCEGCLRITVGSSQENQRLVSALQNIGSHAPANQSPDKTQPPLSTALPSRKAVIQRKTNETDIYIALDLDGSGRSDIHTGLGFFDHMLEQLSHHSGCDLTIRVTGDLHIDEHHTVEDTALALGQAFQQALGDKRGIERYGFLLPMDDALAQVALDFSGRSWLVWQADFLREKVGDVPTELFYHFFKSFCDTAKCNLNIKTEGENEHHKIEATFKAVGKSIKMAIRRDPLKMDIPSTKGIL